MTQQDAHRIDLGGVQRTMKAVVTSGHGDYERLVYRDVPVPTLAPGEVTGASGGVGSADLVVDNVAGPAFSTLLKLLKPGGRYVTSGAIAGPLVTPDMCTLYLKNLTLLGCTAWAEPVFANLVGYIERGELRPLMAQSFALDQIAQAQRAFLDKTHVGKFVLIPPPPNPA